MEIKLKNTIELVPFSFAKGNYNLPNGTVDELPAEWNAYWLKSLSDSKIENLAPIKKGMWLVDIETIGDDALRIILKNELSDVDILDYNDQVGIMSGGIAVKMDGEFIITPSCCGDLGDLVEWEELIEKDNVNWNKIWIGHPWLFYKKINRDIAFSEYSDMNLEDLKCIDIKHQLPKSSLVSELLNMRKIQVVFENRIASLLEETGINNSGEIAKLMTGN